MNSDLEGKVVLVTGGAGGRLHLEVLNQKLFVCVEIWELQLWKIEMKMIPMF